MLILRNLQSNLRDMRRKVNPRFREWPVKAHDIIGVQRRRQQRGR
ncbi:hypothetical protein [Rhodopseudomonas sp. RCAM05734]